MFLNFTQSPRPDQLYYLKYPSNLRNVLESYIHLTDFDAEIHPHSWVNKAVV